MRTHVLVVDDEPHIALVMAMNLRRAGFAVETAPDGEQALHMARAAPPRLVVTDFQMPRMRGDELAHALRLDPVLADTPVVLVTARGHLLRGRTCEQLGVQALLAKPFSPKELVEIALRLSDDSQAGRSAAA